MSKYCMNYDSGEYEFIEENGYSISSGEYCHNWDHSEYDREREEKEEREREEEKRHRSSLWDDEDDD